MDEGSKGQLPAAQEPARSSHTLGWCVSLLLAAALVYVLSVGPVARFYSKRIPPAGVMSFYEPLNSLSRNCEPVRVFLNWYVYDLWVRPHTIGPVDARPIP